MTHNDIKAINTGDYIHFKNSGYSEQIIKVCTSGVMTIFHWKNCAGNFCEKNFYDYETLLNDEFVLIN